MRLKTLAAAAAATAAAALLYRRFRRERVLTWGATADEAAARLPGDELLEAADGVATRAITIAAPPSAVWPWIAQMGPAPPGGAYTYDRIENLLGLDMHSADHLLPDKFLGMPYDWRPKASSADSSSAGGTRPAPGSSCQRRSAGVTTSTSHASSGASPKV